MCIRDSFIAKRLRCFSQTLDAITLPQFFFKRFRGKSRAISGFTAIMIVIFFVPYTASGFAACGKLFSSLFCVSYHLALIISAIVIVSYCTLGGFLAASFTDPVSYTHLDVYKRQIIQKNPLHKCVLMGWNRKELH